jgi:hypothetical protein
MSRATYPSWGDQIASGATMTFEAWRLADKSNADLAHPWCASPASIVPRWLAGLQPLEPGWARLRAAPQPGGLAFTATARPTPQGLLLANFSQNAAIGVVLVIDAPAPAQVCLPPLHAAAGGGGAAGEAADELLVDGAPVATQPWGRMLCTQADLAPGVHAVRRRPLAAASAD